MHLSQGNMRRKCKHGKLEGQNVSPEFTHRGLVSDVIDCRTELRKYTGAKVSSPLIDHVCLLEALGELGSDGARL